MEIVSPGAVACLGFSAMNEDDVSKTISGGMLFAIPFIVVLLLAYTIISGGSG